MTKDHDRKALIRARMEKTGESYTAAQRQLFGEEPPSREEPEAEDRTTFSMPNDDTAASMRQAVREKVDEMYARSGVRIDGGDLRVWMGAPAVFSAVIPIASITEVRRLPDGEPGTSLGAHGSRGRWLVNSAYTGLVRITIEPRASARLAPRSALPDAAKGKGGIVLSLLMRERYVKLRELTVSVEDPDALVTALRR